MRQSIRDNRGNGGRRQRGATGRASVPYCLAIGRVTTYSGITGKARRFFASLFAALVVFTGTWPCGGALAESRIALVVGNSGYVKAPLTNPRNDAAAISHSLAAVGFTVRTLIDADQAAMRSAILAFGRELRGADSVGVFYYAGHGVQVDGQNYLIPVGADIADAGEVPLQGISLTELLKTMERAESRLNIAILDACRDNPYPSRTRSVVRGLAPVQSPAGTLIAFATGPGEVALDGTGGNSPYSGALAVHILEEGIPLEETFRRTRRRVLELTGNKQVPWEHSSLTGSSSSGRRWRNPKAGSGRWPVWMRAIWQS